MTGKTVMISKVTMRKTDSTINFMLDLMYKIKR